MNSFGNFNDPATLDASRHLEAQNAKFQDQMNQAVLGASLDNSILAPYKAQVFLASHPREMVKTVSPNYVAPQAFYNPQFQYTTVKELCPDSSAVCVLPTQTSLQLDQALKSQWYCVPDVNQVSCIQPIPYFSAACQKNSNGSCTISKSDLDRLPSTTLQMLDCQENGSSLKCSWK